MTPTDAAESPVLAGEHTPGTEGSTPSADVSERTVRVDSPEDGPPLILLCKHRLRPEAVANLRASWEAAWKGDHTGPKILALEGGMDLFRLIEGAWKKLE